MKADIGCLLALCDKSENDIRSCVNTLQANFTFRIAFYISSFTIAFWLLDFIIILFNSCLAVGISFQTGCRNVSNKCKY